MTSPTGSRAKRPQPEEWSFEITIIFVQVPAAKREAYWSFLSRLAEQIQDLTVPEAEETVSGQEAVACFIDPTIHPTAEFVRKL